MSVDGFGFAAAVIGIVPGILLTGAVAHLRRRGRVTRSGVVMVVTITAVSAAGAVAHLALRPAPVWLPWATVAVSLVIGYGYLARQMVRHRAVLIRPPRASGSKP